MLRCSCHHEASLCLKSWAGFCCFPAPLRLSLCSQCRLPAYSDSDCPPSSVLPPPCSTPRTLAGYLVQLSAQLTRVSAQALVPRRSVIGSNRLEKSQWV